MCKYFVFEFCGLLRLVFECGLSWYAITKLKYWARYSFKLVKWNKTSKTRFRSFLTWMGLANLFSDFCCSRRHSLNNLHYRYRSYLTGKSKTTGFVNLLTLVRRYSKFYKLLIIPFVLPIWASSRNPTQGYSIQDSHIQGHSSQLSLALEPWLE